MFTVVICEGPLSSEDNATYFCDEVHVEVEVALLVKWVVFVPKNGGDLLRGKKMKVPFERLVSISED